MSLCHALWVKNAQCTTDWLKGHVYIISHSHCQTVKTYKFDIFDYGHSDESYINNSYQ